MKESEVHKQALVVLSKYTIVTSEVSTDFGRADLVTMRTVWEVKASLKSATDVASAASQADRYNRLLKKENIGVVFPRAKKSLPASIGVARSYPNLVLLDPFEEEVYTWAPMGGWMTLSLAGKGPRWSRETALVRAIERGNRELEVLSERGKSGQQGLEHNLLVEQITAEVDQYQRELQDFAEFSADRESLRKLI